jgi:hypothetical protein
MTDPTEPTVTTGPADAFAEVCERVLTRHPGDDQGRMLRSPGLRTAGKFYAFATGPDVIVKLPAARVAGLVGSGAGRPCEPRRGSPMREWVVLPVADVDSCLAVVLEARGFVASIAAAST